MQATFCLKKLQITDYRSACQVFHKPKESTVPLMSLFCVKKASCLFMCAGITTVFRYRMTEDFQIFVMLIVATLAVLLGTFFCIKGCIYFCNKNYYVSIFM